VSDSLSVLITLTNGKCILQFVFSNIKCTVLLTYIAKTIFLFQGNRSTNEKFKINKDLLTCELY
jgi:hypothetical protein